MATAQHLQKVDLELRDSDINFLQSCLSSLSYSQSLHTIDVDCNASGVFSGGATDTCMCTFSHMHQHHTLKPLYHTYCILSKNMSL